MQSQHVTSEIEEIPLVDRILYETLDETLTDESSTGETHLDESSTDEILKDESPIDETHLDENDNPYDKVAVRRIALYSENGKESMCLAAYTDFDGTKRIMLNDIDLTLTDFKNYFNSLVENKDTSDEDLMDTLFITSIVVLIIALSITLINITNLV